MGAESKDEEEELKLQIEIEEEELALAKAKAASGFSTEPKLPIGATALFEAPKLHYEQAMKVLGAPLAAGGKAMSFLTGEEQRTAGSPLAKKIREVPDTGYPVEDMSKKILAFVVEDILADPSLYTAGAALKARSLIKKLGQSATVEKIMSMLKKPSFSEVKDRATAILGGRKAAVTGEVEGGAFTPFEKSVLANKPSVEFAKRESELATNPGLEAFKAGRTSQKTNELKSIIDKYGGQDANAAVLSDKAGAALKGKYDQVIGEAKSSYEKFEPTLNSAPIDHETIANRAETLTSEAFGNLPMGVNAPSKKMLSSLEISPIAAGKVMKEIGYLQEGNYIKNYKTLKDKRDAYRALAEKARMSKEPSVMKNDSEVYGKMQTYFDEMMDAHISSVDPEMVDVWRKADETWKGKKSFEDALGLFYDVEKKGTGRTFSALTPETVMRRIFENPPKRTGEIFKDLEQYVPEQIGNLRNAYFNKIMEKAFPDKQFNGPALLKVVRGEKASVWNDVLTPEQQDKLGELVEAAVAEDIARNIPAKELLGKGDINMANRLQSYMHWIAIMKGSLAQRLAAFGTVNKATEWAKHKISAAKLEEYLYPVDEALLKEKIAHPMIYRAKKAAGYMGEKAANVGGKAANLSVIPASTLPARAYMNQPQPTNE